MYKIIYFCNINFYNFINILENKKEYFRINKGEIEE